MVRRNANEAIGDQVDETEGQFTGLEENLDTVCRGRFGLSDGQHAGRDERTVVAALIFLTVRTARHVPIHGGHIAQGGELWKAYSFHNFARRSAPEKTLKVHMINWNSKRLIRHFQSRQTA